ncbi:MAG: hypothetical protein ACKPKO_61695, partial [Candidatus Fonsibacter sp.]
MIYIEITSSNVDTQARNSYNIPSQRWWCVVGKTERRHAIVIVHTGIIDFAVPRAPRIVECMSGSRLV